MCSTNSCPWRSRRKPKNRLPGWIAQLHEWERGRVWSPVFPALLALLNLTLRLPLPPRKLHSSPFPSQETWGGCPGNEGPTTVRTSKRRLYWGKIVLEPLFLPAAFWKFAWRQVERALWFPRARLQETRVFRATCGPQLEAHQNGLFTVVAMQSRCFRKRSGTLRARVFQALAAPARDLGSPAWRARADTADALMPWAQRGACLLRLGERGAGFSVAWRGPIGCRWNFLEAQKQFCSHLAVFCQEAFSWCSPARKVLDLPHGSTAVTGWLCRAERSRTFPASIWQMWSSPPLRLYRWWNVAQCFSVGQMCEISPGAWQGLCLQLPPCYKSFI